MYLFRIWLKNFLFNLVAFVVLSVVAALPLALVALTESSWFLLIYLLYVVGIWTAVDVQVNYAKPNPFNSNTYEAHESSEVLADD